MFRLALPCALVAFLALVSQASAGVLTDWTTGIATHYGGAQEGMNPVRWCFFPSRGRFSFLFSKRGGQQTSKTHGAFFLPLFPRKPGKKNPRQSNPSYGTKEGSCGYGSLSKDQYPFWQVGAFATSNKFFKSIPGSACGTCWEIQCVEGKEFSGRCRDGGGKSVTVTITDSCPECASDHMDLQALVFDKLSPMALGRINMKYR
jgi:hypothetical protein